MKAPAPGWVIVSAWWFSASSVIDVFWWVLTCDAEIFTLCLRNLPQSPVSPLLSFSACRSWVIPLLALCIASRDTMVHLCHLHESLWVKPPWLPFRPCGSFWYLWPPGFWWISTSTWVPYSGAAALWWSLTAIPGLQRRPPLNLVMLVPLSPVCSWWPRWMGCLLGPPVEHYPLVRFLTSCNLSTPAYLPTSAFSFLLWSLARTAQVFLLCLVVASTFSSPLRATLVKTAHPQQSLPGRGLNPVYWESAPKSEFLPFWPSWYSTLERQTQCFLGSCQYLPVNSCSFLVYTLSFIRPGTSPAR